MSDLCESCRWWDFVNHDGERLIGNCRRRAPVAMGAGNPQQPDEALWPVTEGTDWCGDYAAAERRAREG